MHSTAITSFTLVNHCSTGCEAAFTYTLHQLLKMQVYTGCTEPRLMETDSECIVSVRGVAHRDPSIITSKVVFPMLY